MNSSVKTEKSKIVTRKIDIKTKVEEKRFGLKLTKEINGEDLNMKYIQDHGFTTPRRFVDKQGLGET